MWVITQQEAQRVFWCFACVSHLIVPEPGAICGIRGTGIAPLAAITGVAVGSFGVSEDMTKTSRHHGK